MRARQKVDATYSGPLGVLVITLPVAVLMPTRGLLHERAGPGLAGQSGRPGWYDGHGQ
jgi:hypothetical protein